MDAASIYFDNNATTQIAPEVFDAMKPFLTASYGNPSSAHRYGQEARGAVENARRQVAALLGAADPTEIAFTSCGTESDNWAIRGALSARPEMKHIVTTRVEHEAVRNLCSILEKQGYSITWLNVDGDGAVDLQDLKRFLRKDTALVSMMLANNETGVIFPVNKAAEIVKENSNALFHVDAVNAAGKVPIDLKTSGIDLLAISGHKLHGPKGVGALYIRSEVNIGPFLVGGGQEHGSRAGTEAVHQIVGLGEAARLASDMSPMKKVQGIRDRLEDNLLAAIPNAHLNGTSDRELRLPNTSNISFENVNGEAIVARLDDLGVCVSTGSACNSADHTASPVLQAMNVPYSRAMGSIRFSLGRYNTDQEVNFVLERLPQIVAELHGMSV
jgi:cysteine desulfurase